MSWQVEQPQRIGVINRVIAADFAQAKCPIGNEAQDGGFKRVSCHWNDGGGEGRWCCGGAAALDECPGREGSQKGQGRQDRRQAALEHGPCHEATSLPLPLPFGKGDLDHGDRRVTDVARGARRLHYLMPQ